MPKISVLMSVYNGEEFIAESIQSILNQTFKDFELIIVDDGSTDNTVDIIKSFDDPRIKLFTLKENVGVGAALNYGLRKVTGKYIAKVDSDDINHPTRLLKQKEYLDKHKDIDLVKTLIEYFPHNEKVAQSVRYKNMKNIKEKQLNQIVSPEEINKKLYWWCCIPHNSIMARAEVIKRVGYSNVRLGEDYELFYKLNKLGYKMDTIKEILVKFRVRDTSITGSMEYQQEYINLIYNMKKSELESFLEESQKIYIWGTGNLGKYVFNELSQRGYKIEGFIDGIPEKQGKILYDKKVYSPGILRVKQKNKVIVCAQPAREKIVSYLEKLGYEGIKNYFVYA